MNYTLKQGNYNNPEVIHFNDDDTFEVVALPDWSGLKVGETLVCRKNYLMAERGYKFCDLRRGVINSCGEGYFFILNSRKEITAADIV